MDRDKVASNTLYYFLDFATMVIGGYLLWIILGNMLVPEQYGIVFTIISIFSVLAIVTSFGTQESLPKLIPEFKNQHAAGAMIKYAIRMVFIFSFIISLFIYFFSPQISQYFYGSLQMAMPFQFLAYVLFFGSMFFVLKAGLHGLQKFRDIFYGEFAGNVMKIIAAIVLVYSGFEAIGGIFAWVIWFIVSGFLFFHAPRKIEKIECEFDKIRLFNYSLWSVLYLLSTIILLQGSIILLSIMTSLEASAFFGTAFVFGQFLLFIPFVLVGALMPTMSEQWGIDINKVRELLHGAIKSIFLWVFPMFVVFSLQAEFLIDFIYNIQYIEAASIFPIYSFGTFLMGISMMLMIALYTGGHPKRRSLTFIIGALLNVGLAWFLISVYGLMGAAVAFLAAQIFIFLVTMFFVHDKVGLRFNEKNLLWLVPITIFSGFVYIVSYFDGFWEKIAMFVISGFVYLVLLDKLDVLEKKDIAVFTQLIKRMKIKVNK